MSKILFKDDPKERAENIEAILNLEQMKDIEIESLNILSLKGTLYKKIRVERIDKKFSFRKNKEKENSYTVWRIK